MFSLFVSIPIEVDQHPFDINEMLFMDWRSDYVQGDKNLLKNIKKVPSFLYVMPLSETVIFVEETSLVARPAASFEEMAIRLTKRLDYNQK